IIQLGNAHHNRTENIVGAFAGGEGVWYKNIGCRAIDGDIDRVVGETAFRCGYSNCIGLALCKSGYGVLNIRCIQSESRFPEIEFSATSVQLKRLAHYDGCIITGEGGYRWTNGNKYRIVSGFGTADGIINGQ